MRYQIKTSTKFKKDVKKAKIRGYDISKLASIIERLSRGEKLDLKYYDHGLSGDYEGYRECHIESDWLLIYKINNEKLFLLLTRTGTHSDLF